VREELLGVHSTFSPSPSQAGQAPTCVLNEKWRGSSSPSIWKPQVGQVPRVPCSLRAPLPLTTTLTRPPLSAWACSTASAMRRRAAGANVTRSSTRSTRAPSGISGVSVSKRASAPSISTRV
jgi:hypothetical protein